MRTTTGHLKQPVADLKQHVTDPEQSIRNLEQYLADLKSLPGQSQAGVRSSMPGAGAPRPACCAR